MTLLKGDVYIKGNYCVYAHINKKNGKMYIGITNNVKHRWGISGCHYKDSPKFWAAICKYGWDGFEHKILIDSIDRETARDLEKEYIQTFDSINNGYNISPGGDIPPVFYGKDNHNYGSHFSDETRRKMSENHADFSKGKHPRAKKVICVETEQIFETITEAAKYANISRSCIRDVCENRQDMSAGYHWRYCNSDL